MEYTRDALPEVVYAAAQVAALDARYRDDYGVAGFELMQRAAAAAYAQIGRHWAVPGRLCALCGTGNNGGDGFLVAKYALAGGWQARVVCLVDPDQLKGDAARAAAAFRAAGGDIEGFDNAAIDADVIVDALLGTGLNRDVEDAFADAIERINAAGERGAGILSIDIPSGLDASTGRIWAHTVRADATATFIGLKLGLFTGQGPACCGDIGFDALAAPAALYTGRAYTARRLTDRALGTPARGRTAHKGDHGHLLCVGGNRGMGGSIRLTAEAALRSGAGLVSVVCHPDHAGAMSQARPELMCLGVAAGDDISAAIAAADSVALGPGLGQDAWGDKFWQAALASRKPLVVDADGLNRLAAAPVARGNWILTPHPGEAARLLDTDTADVMADRVAAVEQIARDYAAVVVLKGAGSLIATADELWLCTDGNPGMAVGGMGDLLTGVIAALVAQGLDTGTAAALGVHVHARAGDAAAGEAGESGLLPSDLPTWIRYFLNATRVRRGGHGA